MRKQAVVGKTSPKEQQRCCRLPGLTLDIENRLISGCNGTTSLHPRRVLDPHALCEQPGPGAQPQVPNAISCGTHNTSMIPVLYVNICHLRKKIEEDPRERQRLHTVHGIGYRFSGRLTAGCRFGLEPSAALCGRRTSVTR